MSHPIDRCAYILDRPRQPDGSALEGENGLHHVVFAER
jgi:hypothetical protein